MTKPVTTAPRAKRRRKTGKSEPIKQSPPVAQICTDSLSLPSSPPLTTPGGSQTTTDSSPPLATTPTFARLAWPPMADAPHHDPLLYSPTTKPFSFFDSPYFSALAGLHPPLDDTLLPDLDDDDDDDELPSQASPTQSILGDKEAAIEQKDIHQATAKQGSVAKAKPMNEDLTNSPSGRHAGHALPAYNKRTPTPNCLDAEIKAVSSLLDPTNKKAKHKLPSAKNTHDPLATKNAPPTKPSEGGQRQTPDEASTTTAPVIHPTVSSKTTMYLTELEGVPVCIALVKAEEGAKEYRLIRRMDMDYVNATPLLMAGGITTADERNLILGLEINQFRIRFKSSPWLGTWIPIHRARSLALTCSLMDRLDLFLRQRVEKCFPSPLPWPIRHRQPVLASRHRYHPPQSLGPLSLSMPPSPLDLLPQLPLSHALASIMPLCTNLPSISITAPPTPTEYPWPEKYHSLPLSSTLTSSCNEAALPPEFHAFKHRPGAIAKFVDARHGPFFPASKSSSVGEDDHDSSEETDTDTDE
ncbi:hypothetical protein DM01DRAFT_1341996 [Hesseltinella vesiculosa]|uniref:HTH APSES-type domain-containing protein n=1 Tax=Hesseltinella vesiculosa TaxID=101127 RepID=A0A1X2GVQ6_9FUNG|nr:hypothetical protein DM01DRAFT_1341996 [Hesseltinella vesiculosa]